MIPWFLSPSWVLNPWIWQLWAYITWRHTAENSCPHKQINKIVEGYLAQHCCIYIRSDLRCSACDYFVQYLQSFETFIFHFLHEMFKKWLAWNPSLMVVMKRMATLESGENMMKHKDLYSCQSASVHQDLLVMDTLGPHPRLTELMKTRCMDLGSGPACQEVYCLSLEMGARSSSTIRLRCKPPALV